VFAGGQKPTASTRAYLGYKIVIKKKLMDIESVIKELTKTATVSPNSINRLGFAAEM
jgi:hypothetical protein